MHGVSGIAETAMIPRASELSCLRNRRRCRIVAGLFAVGMEMSQQNEAERELAGLLVESLNLEDVDPAQIDPEAALFNDGLGLDSIDALELGLALQKKYGVSMSADSEQTRQHFSSVNALVAFVSGHRAA